MRFSKTVLIAVLVSLASAIPINITTYNYISYDVSRFFYVNSALKNIDLGVNFDPLYFDTPGHYNYRSINEDQQSINTKSLLLLSDSKIVKLNHDYNNVLYCLAKYIKNLKQKNNKLMDLDDDLISFIKNTKSTDEFLENVIKNKSDVKNILNNLHLEEDINDERFLDSILEEDDDDDYEESYLNNATSVPLDFFPIQPGNNRTQLVNVNLIHLYHLTPIVDDTFKYQIFHKVNFNHPNLDESINKTFDFLYNETFLKTFVNMINDLTNKDIQITFGSKNHGNNLLNNIHISTYEKILHTGEEKINKIPLSDVKLQLNLLILINLGFLGLKIIEFINGNNLLFSTRHLYFL